MTQRSADMHPFLACDYHPEVTAHRVPGLATDFTIRFYDKDGEVVETQTATGREEMRQVLRDRMNHYRRLHAEEQARDNTEEAAWPI